MRAPPTTAEFVEELALRDGSRPALWEDGHQLTVGQLHEMLLGCGQALHELGVRHGDCIAVSGPGFGIQLLLLLAAERLGAVTASFLAEEDPDAEFLFAQVQWVFSALPQATPAGVRFQRLDAGFLQLLQRRHDLPLPDWSPAELTEPHRFARTSGSSGRSKFMVLTRAAQEHWIGVGTDKTTYAATTRLLVLGPLTMNAAVIRAAACLRRGGVVIASASGAQLPELAPTHVWGLPLQLEGLLAEAPPGYTAPQPVHVSTVGGVMAPGLRARTARVFQGAVWNRYGSNEAGAICDSMDADGVGLLLAGVDVRILDPDGREVPPGEPGRIALRTPSLVEGYLGLPEETAEQFRDGWFISSDVGMLVGYRRLRLLGREDDVVNLGGLKVPASILEADLRALPAIAEVAVLAVHLGADAASLGVAVVLAANASREQATEQITGALRLASGMSARVLFLPQLPRMRSDKLDRMALLQLFRDAG